MAFFRKGRPRQGHSVGAGIGRCPRCVSALAPEAGEVGEHICPTCSGRFIPRDAFSALMVDQLGVTPEMVRELTAHFAGARPPCAGCGQLMRPVTLKQVRVDVCLHCGGLWCDAGEFARLSLGRYEEVCAAPGSLQTRPPEPASKARSCVFLLDRHAPNLTLAHEAFRAAGLSANDLHVDTALTTGVLAVGLPAAHAAVLCTALKRFEVAAVVVADTWLFLPPPRKLRRFTPRDSDLEMVDQSGRTETHAWETVTVVSIGCTRLGAETTITPGRWISSGHSARYIPPVRALVENDTDIIDILVGHAEQRFRLSRDCLSHAGLNAGKAAPGNLFKSVGHEVMRRATRATTNIGANHLATQGSVLRYRNRVTFEREQAWLYWRHSGAEQTQ